MLIFRGLPGTSDPYVKIGMFNSRTYNLLVVIDNWSQLNKKSVNINAIDNGVHGSGGTKFTFHGKSLAWDISPTTFLSEDYKDLAKYLQLRLLAPYQVIVEVDHIHIEWDTGQSK
jgi:hypothetical protein